MNTAMTVWQRLAYRLLTLTLLIFALADLVPATGVWRIVIIGATALVLTGLIAVSIGLDRIFTRAPWGLWSDRSAPSPLEAAHHSMTRWRTGPNQP